MIYSCGGLGRIWPVTSPKPIRMPSAAGTVAQMNAAFAVDLGRYESATEKYRGREGFVHVPNEIAERVEGVFGLDTRRLARRMNGMTRSSSSG